MPIVTADSRKSTFHRTVGTANGGECSPADTAGDSRTVNAPENAVATECSPGGVGAANQNTEKVTTKRTSALRHRLTNAATFENRSGLKLRRNCSVTSPTMV